MKLTLYKYCVGFKLHQIAVALNNLCVERYYALLQVGNDCFPTGERGGGQSGSCAVYVGMVFNLWLYGMGGRCRGWGGAEVLEQGPGEERPMSSSSSRQRFPSRLRLGRRRHCQQGGAPPGPSVNESCLRTTWCSEPGKVCQQELCGGS